MIFSLPTWVTLITKQKKLNFNKIKVIIYLTDRQHFNRLAAIISPLHWLKVLTCSWKSVVLAVTLFSWSPLSKMITGPRLLSCMTASSHHHHHDCRWVCQCARISHYIIYIGYSLNSVMTVVCSISTSVMIGVLYSSACYEYAKMPSVTCAGWAGALNEMY